MATEYPIPNYEEYEAWGFPDSNPCSEEVYEPTTSEYLADDPLYRMDRKRVDDGFFKIGQKILGVIAEARPEDKQLGELRKFALDIQKVNPPTTYDIAFVGSQGTGKSLCINALQHRPNLSKTSAWGRACTSSSVRFRLKSDATDYSESFDAVIRFWSDADLRTLIAEHVRRYSYVHLHEKGDEISEDDTLAADAAKRFFELIHNTHNDWVAASNLKSLLSHTNIHNGSLLETTVEIANECIIERTAGQEREITFSNMKLDELMVRVETYISDKQDSPSLWPLIEHIDVLLWSWLAKHGIGFIDTPGQPKFLLPHPYDS
jgi:hypothetical protein